MTADQQAERIKDAQDRALSERAAEHSDPLTGFQPADFWLWIGLGVAIGVTIFSLVVSLS